MLVFCKFLGKAMDVLCMLSLGMNWASVRLSVRMSSPTDDKQRKNFIWFTKHLSLHLAGADSRQQGDLFSVFSRTRPRGTQQSLENKPSVCVFVSRRLMVLYFGKCALNIHTASLDAGEGTVWHNQLDGVLTKTEPANPEEEKKSYAVCLKRACLFNTHRHGV
ncbi:hypothetical protein BaRGS_00012586 [Batillaria attramentaria]|uniref:Secreted protein n=1 Tax=Batillaria attramentaria TaxID=370345 RepID=A0ABD0LA73_9CAEN